jgi:hypothetical protein
VRALGLDVTCSFVELPQRQEPRLLQSLQRCRPIQRRSGDQPSRAWLAVSLTFNAGLFERLASFAWRCSVALILHVTIQPPDAWFWRAIHALLASANDLAAPSP